MSPFSVGLGCTLSEFFFKLLLLLLEIVHYLISVHNISPLWSGGKLRCNETEKFCAEAACMQHWQTDIADGLTPDSHRRRRQRRTCRRLGGVKWH